MSARYVCPVCEGTGAGAVIARRQFPCGACKGAGVLERDRAIKLVVGAAVTLRFYGIEDAAAAALAAAARRRGDLGLAFPYERARELGACARLDDRSAA